MAREFKEVSRFRTDIEKFNENFDRIFGKKDKQDWLRELGQELSKTTEPEGVIVINKESEEEG